jgi:CheY-like chemotaxis protein
MKNHLVLMLEYDEDDQFLTLEYFRDHSPQIEVQMVTSSDALLVNLSQCKAGKKPWPSLLILNYDSTPKNAVEILADIKKDEKLRHLPVVVLSGTVIPSLVRECYAHGASSFIQKPALTEETNTKIKTFIDYWFRMVELS